MRLCFCGRGDAWLDAGSKLDVSTWLEVEYLGNNRVLVKTEFS